MVESSIFKGRCLKEELSGLNFNDRFHSPKMVLRVEKKLSVIEQPIPLAPYVDSKYLRSGMLFMMLIMRLLVLCLEKSNKKLLNTKGKGKGKGKGKDKSYIPKPKNPKPYAKDYPTKDDACHHCKEVGHCKRNFLAYLAELIKKKKQFTPPYTPQYNGVSERRNSTLLDMVRSMINLITFLLSFWEYALWTATRILNIVTTKKVDKTQYELWYGKVPNLPYLKDTKRKRWVTISTSHLKTKLLLQVCKLQRSNYGLKQTSKSQNKRFDEEIKRFGFAQNLDEPCVYQKASGSNVTFLILYTDDIIIMGNHISLQSVKSYLGKCFTMKDLGEAAFILGIKIYRDRSKRLIGLSQYAYLDEILKGSRWIIPNVNTVKTILKYLRNTKDMFLVYGENPEVELRVDCYCNAGFETDRDDIKSQT
ncbi:retrotransposon protein, putative, ty1-copia subclass [Tanacetum coccineum]